MKTLAILLSFLPYLIFSQVLPKESRKWLEENLNDKNVDSVELLDSFIKYDFSAVWLSHQDAMLGFIGDNYQRFYIHFNEIFKNQTKPSCYIIKGKTRAKNNVCDFEGEIRILNIREINRKQREEMLKDGIEFNESYLIKIGKNKQYMILSECRLKEKEDQKWAGTIIGIMQSFFYISNDTVYYYDLDLEYRDSFSNNLFVGIWKMYNSREEKKCHWGNYRIPCSSDLDIGAGEFSPNDKYLEYGWESYRKAHFHGDQDALDEENRKWWTESTPHP